METKKEVKLTGLDTREMYEAPVIEAVEVRVEQGFQMSTVPTAPSSIGTTNNSFWSY